MNSEFKPLAKDQTCGVCGKPDWCRRSKDGGHECHRVNLSEVGGLRRVATTEQGFGVYRNPNDDGPEGLAKWIAGKEGWTLQTIYRWPMDHARARFLTAAGEKTFRPMHKNGRGWKLGDPQKPYALYGSDSLGGTELVLVVEGEKCADAARRIGFAAVTSGSADSAGNADWTSLRGCDVVVLPDNDAPGRKYAQAVAAKLAGIARTIRSVDLPGLSDKGDLVDFIEARDSRTRDEIATEIRELIAASPAGSPPQAPTVETTWTGATRRVLVTSLAEVHTQRAAWLWYRRMARRSITILAGPPGKGKSLIAADIIARVTTGSHWPLDTDRYAAAPGRVLLIAGEDDPGMTLRPRIEAAGGDVSQVVLLQAVEVNDEQGETSRHLFHTRRDSPLLANLLDGVQLVVVDPLSLYLGGRTDTHKHAETYAALAPLAALAQEKGVAVLAVHHFNKGAAPDALAKIMGSVAFAAIARNVWVVMDDPDGADERLFAHAKASLGPLMPSLRFRIVENQDQTPRIDWTGLTDQTADQLNERQNAARGGDEGPDAEAWLRENLSTTPVSSKELMERGKAEGYAESTLKRARRKLGVKTQEQRDDKGRVRDWLVWLPGGDH